MLGEQYTRWMAKRFNVSIPDALAERLEPHKNQISLSALMQAAIERELAQLTSPTIAKDLQVSFKVAAVNAWIERNWHINKAISAYVECLFERVIHDGHSDLFRIYRLLYLMLRKDELRNRLMHDPRYSLYRLASKPGAEGHDALTQEDNVERALDYAMKGMQESGLSDDFLCFIKTTLKSDPSFLPAYLWTHEDDKVFLSAELELAVNHAQTTNQIPEAMLKMIDSRVRAILSDKEIETYLLDFESAFGEWEED
jgi:hypothetical protein